MNYLFCFCSLSIVAVFGAEYQSQWNTPCSIPTGLSEVDKCDWGQANQAVIGGCYEFDNNKQCLALTGGVSACEKKGEVTVSAELKVEVGIDTWLGHKAPEDVTISFDLKVGTKAATVYVYEMSEGILIIKAEPDFTTSRVQLWATYFLNNDDSCAYLTTDKLSISAPLDREDESKDLEVSALLSKALKERTSLWFFASALILLVTAATVWKPFSKMVLSEQEPFLATEEGEV